MDLIPKQYSIKEDFELRDKRIGTGLNGAVYLCADKHSHKEYALKTLKDSLKARREIELHWRACQNCKYIVQIKDVYENVVKNQMVHFVVMEYVSGGELFAKIKRRAALNMPFTEQEVAKMMFQISSAVKHLHDMGIVHRDLKPENLLISGTDTDYVIKLCDFGFAKEFNGGLKTPCYTPYYAAPEVLDPNRYDKSCDIWSLGVIMYILLSGVPPFYSLHGLPLSPGMKSKIKAGYYEFPKAEWARVSDEAKSLIKTMLEPLPEKRIQIDDVVQNSWISKYNEVPKTTLPTLEILRNEEYADFNSALDTALSTMRIDYDNKISLKDVANADNPLLKRRMERASRIEKQQQQQQQEVKQENDLQKQEL